MEGNGTERHARTGVSVPVLLVLVVVAFLRQRPGQRHQSHPFWCLGPGPEDRNRDTQTGGSGVVAPAVGRTVARTTPENPGRRHHTGVVWVLPSGWLGWLGCRSKDGNRNRDTENCVFCVVPPLGVSVRVSLVDRGLWLMVIFGSGVPVLEQCGCGWCCGVAVLWCCGFW